MVDFNENLAVTAGLFATSSSSFWPANDVELVNCEGTDCYNRSDWDTMPRYQGFLHFIEHDNYDSHKTYLLTNAKKNVMANNVQLSQATEHHQVMKQARENWGMNLSSTEAIKGIGALSIGTLSSSFIYE